MARSGPVVPITHNLLRSPDGGQTWETRPTPFGVLPVVALEATETLIFALTFDPHQQIIRLWRSADSGETWQRGAEVGSVWPIVATFADPAMIGIGTLIIVEQASDQWARAEVESQGRVLMRKIVRCGDRLVALTTGGLLYSEDQGAHWTPLDAIQIESDRLMDIASDAEHPGDLFLLLVGGQVRVYRLSEL